jgi:hypothetical protein
MIRRKSALLAVTALLGALSVGVLAAPAQAALRHLDGTVVSKNADARSFRIATQSGTVRVRVNARTEFERIAGGFGGLHKGMRIEVDAARTGDGLLARHVEPRGGGGGGSDDGPNHT